MQIGIIGSGRMGADMARRLLRAGHECVVYDIHAGAVQALARDGAHGATGLDDLPAPIISAALYARFGSRGESAFGDKLLSALRYEFGGHVEKTTEGR